MEHPVNVSLVYDLRTPGLSNTVGLFANASGRYDTVGTGDQLIESITNGTSRVYASQTTQPAKNVYFADFSLGQSATTITDEGYTLSNTPNAQNLWHVTANRQNSTSIYFGDETAGNYAKGVRVAGRYTSPVIDLRPSVVGTNNLELTLRSWIKTERTAGYDNAKIYIRKVDSNNETIIASNQLADVSSGAQDLESIPGLWWNFAFSLAAYQETDTVGVRV